jgi:hypothetical protein
MHIKIISKISLLFILTTPVTLVQATDIQNGKSLHQAKCYQCHAEKSGLGNGDIIYTRLDRKAKDLSKVKSMVGMCNTELRLDLFPEDEADLVAYINQQFYKYK